MYERFTDRARKVMQLANQEAQRFNHEYIRTEHILLGLVKEGSGVAANALKNLNINLDNVRREVEKVIPYAATETPVPGRLPRTPRAQMVIEHAIDETRRMKHNYVGTEHLLLGLLRETEGVAAEVLMNLGLSLERVRSEVMSLLGSKSSQDIQPSVASGPVSSSAPARLSDEERREIEQRISRLEEDKEVFVAAQNFEDATRARSELMGLRTLLAWYDWFRRYP
jgi:ATP-dependent Clp protease ATP-binding subunit ClpC